MSGPADSSGGLGELEVNLGNEGKLPNSSRKFEGIARNNQGIEPENQGIERKIVGIELPRQRAPGERRARRTEYRRTRSAKAEQVATAAQPPHRLRSGVVGLQRGFCASD